jgi:hypothetical protein
MRQIRLAPLGLWHRPMVGNGGDHTACGELITGPVAIRETDLELDLCPLCFSKHERDTGKMKRLRRRSIRESDAESWFDDEESTERDITIIPNDHDRDKT